MIGRTLSAQLEAEAAVAEAEAVVWRLCRRVDQPCELHRPASVAHGYMREAFVTVNPTAPRIRVERCLDVDAELLPRTLAYAPGWLVLYGYGPGDWCHHAEWDTAMACALDRARARALGLMGRW